MKYRQLGSSDLSVSEISLGTWLTYSGGVEKTRAEECVRRALDLGINLLDTANIYGRGASESFLGEALSGVSRQSYVLATKLYFPMAQGDYGLSARQVRAQLDASLKRLRTDYIDLYQCHRYDHETPIEETIGALTEAVRKGKVRYVGFSEWTPEQIRASLLVPDSVRFVSSQPQYHMLARGIEREVIPLCAAEGISQIVWSPLAQGVLTGKYKPGGAVPKDSRAASNRMNGFMNAETMSDAVLSAVDALGPIAHSLDLSLAQLALAWVLRQPNVASAIIGASRPEQIDDNVGAIGLNLSPETLTAIDTVLAPVL